MTRTLLINVCLFAAALLAAFFFFRPVSQIPQRQQDVAADTPLEYNQDQVLCVRDAGGVLVPAQSYQHIISLSTSVDAWLIECLGAGRIHAYCSFSNDKPYAAALEGKKHFANVKDIEALIAAGGDLIIMPTMGGDVSVVNRLREAGLTVFNIGDMSGMESFKQYARDIAWLCKVPVAGDGLLAEFQNDMHELATFIPKGKRHTALYLGIYGDQLFGGTSGSSYHDVLVHAGLIDCSSDEEYDWSSAWPQYSVEQVLAMDPQYIITQQSMAARLRTLPGMAALSAVKEQRVIEMDPHLINDAGLLMHKAAEALQFEVYGHNP